MSRLKGRRTGRGDCQRQFRNQGHAALAGGVLPAGVREFWLADARGDEAVFIIHSPGLDGFEPAVRDADGFQPSAVLGCRFRLDAARDEDGNWEFDLREQA